MDVTPISSDDDHKATLRLIDQLWSAKSGTPDGDRLDVLLALVEAYEARRWPPPATADPIDVIVAHMDASGYTRSDLSRVLGSPSRASEILNRKRPLTLTMIQRLHSDWGIPADLLVQPYAIAAA
jgi:HTH-type transcriptional regulator/antitoxin HigA